MHISSKPPPASCVSVVLLLLLLLLPQKHDGTAGQEALPRAADRAGGWGGAVLCRALQPAHVLAGPMLHACPFAVWHHLLPPLQKPTREHALYMCEQATAADRQTGRTTYMRGRMPPACGEL